MPKPPRTGVTSEYPKTLIHPGYAPAVITTSKAVVGAPDRFPPVIVHNADQEEEYCAKGYAPGALVDAIRILWLKDSPDKSMAEPPARSLQQLDRDRYEAQLDPASRKKLEQRQDAGEAARRLGHWPITEVREMLEQGGIRHAWAEMEAVGILGRIKLRGMIDGEPGEVDPRWLAFVAFEPDGGVIYFDQEEARKKGVKVPLRASNVTVETSGIEEVWPGVTKPDTPEVLKGALSVALDEPAETAKTPVMRPRRRRHRNGDVEGLISEGVCMYNKGSSMRRAASSIAARAWPKNKKLAHSENALVDQIRRGISEHLKLPLDNYPQIPQSPPNKAETTPKQRPR
jgi:hypothetical protein